LATTRTTAAAELAAELQITEAEVGAALAKRGFQDQSGLLTPRQADRIRADYGGARARPAGKLRVYELAKELGRTNKETIDLAQSIGLDLKSHSSTIPGRQADELRRRFSRQELEQVPALTWTSNLAGDEDRLLLAISSIESFLRVIEAALETDLPEQTARTLESDQVMLSQLIRHPDPPVVAIYSVMLDAWTQLKGLPAIKAMLDPRASDSSLPRDALEQVQDSIGTLIADVDSLAIEPSSDNLSALVSTLRSVGDAVVSATPTESHTLAAELRRSARDGLTGGTKTLVERVVGQVVPAAIAVAIAAGATALPTPLGTLIRAIVSLLAS
jgi:hypothetical protein